MYKISEIISKPVYTIYEGIEVGTVLNVLYDNRLKKVKGFFIFDDESDMEQYITSKNIYKIGDDNILIKNRNKVQISKFDKKSILNLELISLNGETAGEIKDIYFNENYTVSAVETKKRIVIPANNIANIGQDVAIFDNEEKKINIARMKPIAKILVENLPNIKVEILEEEKLQNIPVISNVVPVENFLKENKVISERVSEKPIRKISLPPKILSNPRSIIGKYAKEIVCGLNGEIIIKKGQMITDKIYEKAQKHSKLFELTNNAN